MLNRRLFLLLLVALLTACAAGDRRKNEVMHLTLEGYGAALRWGDMRSALNFVDPEEKPEPQKLRFILKRFDQVRVTSYREVSSTPGIDADHIQVVAEIRFSNKHTAVERTIVDRQIWRWDAEVERWWLMTGLPDISRGQR